MDNCLSCGKRITFKVSNRPFCLMCGIQRYDLIIKLKRLNLNFFFRSEL